MPAATPLEIVDTLHRTIVELVAQRDVQEHLEALDFYLVNSTREAFAERIKVELETWRALVKAANIKPE